MELMKMLVASTFLLSGVLIILAIIFIEDEKLKIKIVRTLEIVLTLDVIYALVAGGK